jgi:hypothetical protein
MTVRTRYGGCVIIERAEGAARNRSQSERRTVSTERVRRRIPDRDEMAAGCGKLNDIV